MKLALKVGRQHDGVLVARGPRVVFANVRGERARVRRRIRRDLAAQVGRVVKVGVVVLHFGVLKVLSA